MISLAITGSVAAVTLSRAPVNAINDEWLAELDRVLDRIQDAQNVSLLLLSSAEKAFCAGADLAVMRERFATEAGRRQMVELAGSMQRVFARLEAMPLISVAQIEGAALGGGCELALACDLRVASESAQIGLPEARLGLLPGAGGTQRLTRLCGDALARRLILGAEVLSGNQAAELGVVHWVQPDEQLAAFMDSLISRLTAIPRQAVAESKRCIAAALDAQADGYAQELAGTLKLYENPKTQAKVRQFLEPAG